MNELAIKTDVSLLPARRRLLRGFLIAATLWLLFLVVTAYTSAATLLDRVGSTDVMRAASGGVGQGKIAWEIGVFLATQVLLHLAFAGLTWGLALATAVISATAREKFGRMVVGWFCVLAGAVLSYSALWFPRTLFGAYYHDTMATPVGPLALGQLAYFAALALCVVVASSAAFVWFRRSTPVRRRRAAWAFGVLALVAIVSTLGSGLSGSKVAAAEGAKPHVLLIGIDSLRLEQLKRYGGTGVTPNLDRFLEPADLFVDTTTPAARTFSSWVAILTGRAPTITGARFNLAERSGVSANPTIADVLRQQGYRTIYSTDEVRFANIDESYGFDHVVTPRIGASDFLVGTYNELPLASLFINRPIGKWLFPFSHANRGVATMFQPETYLDRVRREVAFERPTLFISHLTAAHWPYYTSETPFGVRMHSEDGDRPLYKVGLRTADQMFGELVDVLEAKGALRNAIVIVLSDHGEALALPSDSFFDETFRVEGLRAPLKMIDSGHGQSVLSRSQYHVLLAFRKFGAASDIGVNGRSLTFPSTVEDIAPTILELLGKEGDPLAATGQSLLPVLEGRAGSDAAAAGRVRFTETDLKVLPTPGGGVDEVGTARQNSKFFEVDPRTARLHIRPLYAPLAIAYKERAAFTRDHLLAAIPAGPYAHEYLYLDFSRNHGRVLLERPGDDAPEAQRLWDAIARHYGDELKQPVSITPADWPRIDEEWQNFIQPGRTAGTASPVVADSLP